MVGKEQANDIQKRRVMTIKAFLEHPTYSDTVLARFLIKEGIITSSSTVGRDLTGEWIMKDFNQELYDKILLLRSINKKDGKSKGGKISQENYNFRKDECGHFTGCTRR